MELDIITDKTNLYQIITYTIIGIVSTTCVLIGYKAFALISILVLPFIAIVIFAAKFDLIVIIQIFLLSFALTDPAPCDLLFIPVTIFFIISKGINVKKLHSQPLTIALLSIFIVINVLTTLNAINYFASVRFLVITIYLFVFSVFIFLYSSPENYVVLLRAYILSSLIASVLSFIGYAGYFQSVLMMDEFRVKALFKDPNVFGPFIIPAAIILIDDFKQRRMFKVNAIIQVLIIAIILGGVAISFSRAAWISAAISVAAYFILNIKRINIVKTIAYICLLSLMVFLGWNFVIDSTIKDFVMERAQLQSYDEDRFASQAAGIKLATNNPFGYGPGQHEIVVAKTIGQIISAHSLYVRIFIENGVIGFISFTTALIYICFKLFVLHFNGEKVFGLCPSVLLSVLLGIMVNSLVIDTLHWRHFWFFIGLSLSVTANSTAVLKYNTHNSGGT